MRPGGFLKGGGLFGRNGLVFFAKANVGAEGLHRRLGGLFGVAGLQATDGGLDERRAHGLGDIEVEARADALEPSELIADAHGASGGPIADERVDEGRRGWGGGVPEISALLRFPSLSAQIPTRIGDFRRSFLTLEGPLRHGEDMGGGTKSQYSPAGYQRIPGGDRGHKNPEAPT